MSIVLGSPEKPYRVAIIGAGPAGFYTAIELLKNTSHYLYVDMFERLPAPFGLVRHGVAPDHLSIKNVTSKYSAIFRSDRVRLFGNVHYGKDLFHEDLRHLYDAVVYTVGAQADRQMGIPGEFLPGSLSATEFVAWYNGHPDFVSLNPNLSVPSVAVIGMGNVALDVARILAKSGDELHPSDMAEHALNALRASQIRDIYILGRRGPIQAKWTLPELKEMEHLEVADLVVQQDAMLLDAHSEKERITDRIAAKNFAQLQVYAARPLENKLRRVHFRFWASPVEICETNGWASCLRVEQTRLDEAGKLRGTGLFETIPVGMVLRSVGYKGVALPGLPFDEANGVIPNQKGRIYNPETGHFIPHEYVAGWIKRGATGVIGTNKMCGVETAHSVLEDLRQAAQRAYSQEDVAALLHRRKTKFLTFNDWEILDEHEKEQGTASGRPRIKVVEAEKALKIASRRKGV
ncbi:MAG: FAD-dependent oxidoreductase [Bacteroidetes Order II. Incertae sedis bacterium]|nr:FAD-dependent oxidoreductase [Bacteroidetes Order II. bacterium]